MTLLSHYFSKLVIISTSEKGEVLPLFFVNFKEIACWKKKEHDFGQRLEFLRILKLKGSEVWRFPYDKFI